MNLYGVEIELIRKPIKNIYLSVRPGGQVRITAPSRLSVRDLDYFVAEKLEWIKKQLALMAQRPEESQAAPEYRTGEEHLLWGRRLPLELIQSPRLKAELADGKILLSAPRGSSAEERRQLLESFCRSQLRAALPRLLEKWQPAVGARCSGWQIRDMKSRWGSCNVRTGKLCFNLRLVQKPPRCLEYVVVHELCHLHVPNHSPRFWALVAAQLPDWKARRAETNGALQEEVERQVHPEQRGDHGQQR